MDRARVYSHIDSERLHQDRKWGTIDRHPHEVGGWITIMQALLDDAAKAWSSMASDYVALCEIRKVAAVAVACMEQHGSTPRSKFEEPPVESMR